VAEAVLLDRQQRSRLIKYAAARFGIESADAEDLLQDTALALLRQRGYVQDGDAFAFTVFRARCARFAEVRRRRRETFSPMTDGAETFPHPVGPERIDRRVALQEALVEISSSCRRLLSAYYVEGQSLLETAQTLGLASSGVTRTINRCLKRLRACLR
jgi:RNA polymerase sigma factor (sigma-70 family)